MQTTFRANLSAANFPFVSNWMGRTIIIPQYDENFQRRASFSGDDPDLDIGIPQAYYMHNVLPVGQGLKSIAYTKFIPAKSGVIDFVRIEAIQDAALNRAFLASTYSGALYIYTATTTSWQLLAQPTPGWNGKDWSYTNVSGNPYLCLGYSDIYNINIVAKSLTSVVLAGITNSAIGGIFSSSNYLLLWDPVTIYWSSALDPLDFVPSTTTGAGSETPVDLDGAIVVCKSLANGYGVYTTGNAVSASYSGNIRFPWVFREINNSAGVASGEQVAEKGDTGVNYLWSTAGILKVQSASAGIVYPEVSDFLAGRIFEDFDADTNEFNIQYLTDTLSIKIGFIASRYLVLSYGIVPGIYTHALVYDTGFKRWGKLKVTHADCFELHESADGAPLHWNGVAGSWAGQVGTAWNEEIGLSNEVAITKRTMGFLQLDGTCVYATFDYGNYASEAVVLMGKYQMTRSQNTGLQGFSIQDIDITNANFETVITTTYDGQTPVVQTIPYALPAVGNTKSFLCDVVGASHSVAIKGAFHLVSLLLTVTRHGRS